MIIKASKRLRKFFDRALTDEIIWEEIIREGRLHNIHQLTRLNVEAAHALVKLEKRMNLLSLGIVELSPEVAGALARYNGVKLMLNCVRELSPDAARAISIFKGGKLSFNGISLLSLPMLGRLAPYRGVLSLKGVEDFHIEEKNGLRSETVFKSLECSRLILDGVAEPSLSFLKALSRFRGFIELNGVRTLTPEQVEILSSHVGSGISLGRIAVIDSAFSGFFKRYKGRMDISGAVSITEKELSEAALRDDRLTRFSAGIKERIKKWKEEEKLQAEKFKEQLVLDFSSPPSMLDLAEQPQAGSDMDAQLLDEFEEFDQMALTPVAPVQQQWERDDSDDPYEIDDLLLDNIESGLNKEIERKKGKIHQLLQKGFSNLLTSEKEQLAELRESVDSLKDNIRSALNVLVEQKELGSVVFTSSVDLVSYLKDVGEDDENDALARLDDDDFDIFGGDFSSSGNDDGIGMDIVPKIPVDSIAKSGNNILPSEPPPSEDIEGDGFVLSF